jgi:hypothetical protein
MSHKAKRNQRKKEMNSEIISKFLAEQEDRAVHTGMMRDEEYVQFIADRYEMIKLPEFIFGFKRKSDGKILIKWQIYLSHDKVRVKEITELIEGIDYPKRDVNEPIGTTTTVSN